ncbi:hypothetical protein A8C75_01260 [Marinobacterium aestuarii]|uniref:DUF115 domain-containing protein n=1 Tax=Marinobacterium aestuarii TaxID=1821621 RepID=A0A1A9EU01_9GAMM|nr:hypothetical protein [Marinobacterium aestuarii]ANG61220.1 hypothetical protein A8C75_01260 [Marinobacterium aestuarii]
MMQAPPGVQKYWLWKLSQRLERSGFHKLAAKLYRKALVPGFRHNHHCGADFNLVTSNSCFTVYWKGGRHLEGGLPLRQEMPKSRPCLILGSGPSINELDERLYTECDIFVVNGSILKCTAARRRVRAYIVQDPNFIETSFEIFKQGLDLADSLYLSSHAIAAIARRDAGLLDGRTLYLLERANRAFLLPRLATDEFRARFRHEDWLQLGDDTGPALIGWSHDPARGVFTGSTVVYSALQLGVFAGYDNILLAGVDFSVGVAGGRFYSEGGSSAVSHLDDNFMTQILPSFTLASEILIAGGVRITNLSIDSRLPENVIPKSIPSSAGSPTCDNE